MLDQLIENYPTIRFVSPFVFALIMKFELIEQNSFFLIFIFLNVGFKVALIFKMKHVRSVQR